MSSHARRAVVLFAAWFAAAGCGGSGSEGPRPLKVIEAERRALPALYLAEKTGRRVTAPTTKGPFVDDETGEICYPAYQCTNPKCPGRGTDGEPVLFIHRDPLLRVDENGKIVRDQGPAGVDPATYLRRLGGFLSPTCPECLKHRSLATESRKTRDQYLSWAQPYVLPETARRMKELDAERKTRFEKWRKRIDEAKQRTQE